MAIRAEEIDVGRDRVLVEAWQAGDHAAFDDLYLRHFDRLRAFCERRVQNRADAEEIAQEAFVKALQALPRFEGERRFYPWVSVIAHRLCMDHHRRLARVRPSDQVDPGSVDDDTAGRLALQADIDNLDRALLRLGPRHAEVLELRERQGMSYHEIAAHLDVPHSTVEALLFRARKALRREFAAVSGERLAGFPLVGWLALRLDRIRDRVGDAGAALVTPMAAGAMAAVVGVAMPAGTPVTTPVATVARPPAVEQVLEAPVAPPAVVAPVAAAPSPDAVEPDPAPRSRVVAPIAQAAGVQGGPGTEGKATAQEMPMLVELGPGGAGLDPAAIVTWLVEGDEG